MFATYVTQSPQATIRLGRELAGKLKGGDTVLLFGELGSGKTTFVKGIAEALGIEMTIKSPTFAYVNRYPIQKGELYHYDLYRLEPGAEVTSLGFEESLVNPKAINVVEWADRLLENVPAHFIHVEFKVQGSHRGIDIAFIDNTLILKDNIDAYYEEWQTPLHVRAHCEQVAKVAQQLAEAHIKQGRIINLDLLYTACKLHDMTRVCDFNTLERDRFEEKITDEKWQKWLDLREQYKNKHHADIAHEQLKARGFEDVAEAIRLHKSISISEESRSYDTLEQRLVYYADKRVKHTEIVSAKERFRDGRERYGPHDTEAEKKLFERVEKATYQLEKELFLDLDIEPEDIK